jgi:hypothetical protein
MCVPYSDRLLWLGAHWERQNVLAENRGSGRSPVAKCFMVHFEIKTKSLGMMVKLVFLSFHPYTHPHSSPSLFNFLPLPSSRKAPLNGC